MTELAQIRYLTDTAHDLADIIDLYTSRYPNPRTALRGRRMVTALFRHSGCQSPADLTETDILRWATDGNPANNTVYQRACWARSFLRYCLRINATTTNAAEHLGDPDSPLRTYRRTYGKVQDVNPGRWLTHDEAYGRLLAACQTGTTLGLRDEIAIRLGLLGMRAAEVRSLTWKNFQQLPTITWTGKGRKPRQTTAGNALVTAIRTYRTAYETAIAGTITPDMPVICPAVQGTRRYGPSQARLNYGTPAGERLYSYIVQTRAEQAGLGHVAPHDLRRTAAGILHRATDEHGAHHFDLLDIQKVLGHSDPATTMRSYLEPMQTEVLDRAAAYLD
ncbi:MAG: tyrosine-type recombinase/integrase [Acidimicrobiales bacterium]|jgi:integrase